MNEVLTVAEIKSKYDSEWVLIEDPINYLRCNVAPQAPLNRFLQ